MWQPELDSEAQHIVAGVVMASDDDWCRCNGMVQSGKPLLPGPDPL